jgi:hypothetical protein
MKFIKIAGITIIVLLALAILGVSLVFAQQPSPADSPWWTTMLSMMRGTGGVVDNWQSMQAMHLLMTQFNGVSGMQEWMYRGGGVHSTVWKALADQLGLTPEALAAEINSGKTLAQVAQEKGVSTQDLAATMESGIKTGLAQAVEEGKLTQEQADQMLRQMDGRYEWMITNMSAGRIGPRLGGCHGNLIQGNDL